MMRKLLFSAIILSACAKQQTAHPPVGGVLSQTDLAVSKNRAKSLNASERLQIEDWIKHQDKKFYPMGLNYWTDISGLQARQKKNDGERVSYRYDIYDFSETKLYPESRGKDDGLLGKFEEIKAVEDALHYLRKDEETTLLVPSVLGFGTFGDNDRIPNDLPLIIKLKVL